MPAYNYGFPVTYPQIQQVQQQPMIPTPQPVQQTQAGINWVQGEAGAKSFLMAPNTSALLMDSENPKFYIKTTDSSGMPLPLRVFNYEEETQVVSEEKVANVDMNEYLTKKEFEERIAELKPVQSPKKKEKEVTDE